MTRDRAHTAAHRLAAARAEMARDGFDALLLVNSTNLLFLSGFPVVEVTLARPHYLVVPQRGAPVFLVHEARRYEARRYAWVSDVRTYRRLSVAPIVELAAILGELSLRGGRIGVELGFEQRLGMPFAEFERLRAELAPARFEDAAALLWRLRMVKSPDDIAAVRQACRITAEAFERTFDAVRAGMDDREVATRMREAMTDGGGSGPWVVIAAGRGNYDLAMGHGVGRSLEPGDMVWMDAGCAVDTFWSDYGRGGVVGGPSAEQREGQRLIWEITCEGKEMVRPGTPVSDIAAHCNRRLEELGLPVTSRVSHLAARIGHGIGLDVTEPPHISEEDSTVLEAGMVISIEPGVATEYGIFHIEENVVVTADGHELLSVAPWELRTLAA